MKYILNPIFKIISHIILILLKIFFLLLMIIIGYLVAIGLTLWNFKIERVDMLWLIRTVWNV